MNELTSKIVMWRTALEERNANLGIMQVFDSMCVYLGEQEREIERLRIVEQSYEAYRKAK